MTKPVPIKLPAWDDLLELDSEPRVHPNGFIQLDLDKAHRLHVWHPELPYRQKTYHPIHDHSFSFTSECFAGRLVHVQYGIEPNDLFGTHYMAKAVCTGGSESELVPIEIERFYTLLSQSAEVIQPGEQYTFAGLQFHEILFNVPSLTVIRKDSFFSDETPTVMIPAGVKPDNSFCRADAETDVLWRLIADVYPS